MTCLEAWWSSTFGSAESSAMRNKCRTTNLLTCFYNFACTEIAKRWRKIPRVTSSQTCYDTCPIALCTSYVLPAPFVGSHCGVHYQGDHAMARHIIHPGILDEGACASTVTQGPNVCRPSCWTLRLFVILNFLLIHLASMMIWSCLEEKVPEQCLGSRHPET